MPDTAYRTYDVRAHGELPGSLVWGKEYTDAESETAAWAKLHEDVEQVTPAHVRSTVSDRFGIAYLWCWLLPLHSEADKVSVRE